MLLTHLAAAPVLGAGAPDCAYKDTPWGSSAFGVYSKAVWAHLEHEGLNAKKWGEPATASCEALNTPKLERACAAFMSVQEATNPDFLGSDKNKLAEELREKRKFVDRMVTEARGYFLPESAVLLEMEDRAKVLDRQLAIAVRHEKDKETAERVKLKMALEMAPTKEAGERLEKAKTPRERYQLLAGYFDRSRAVRSNGGGGVSAGAAPRITSGAVGGSQLSKGAASVARTEKSFSPDPASAVPAVKAKDTEERFKPGYYRDSSRKLARSMHTNDAWTLVNGARGGDNDNGAGCGKTISRVDKVCVGALKGKLPSRTRLREKLGYEPGETELRDMDHYLQMYRGTSMRDEEGRGAAASGFGFKKILYFPFDVARNTGYVAIKATDQKFGWRNMERASGGEWSAHGNASKASWGEWWAGMQGSLDGELGLNK